MPTIEDIVDLLTIVRETRNQPSLKGLHDAAMAELIQLNETYPAAMAQTKAKEASVDPAPTPRRL